MRKFFFFFFLSDPVHPHVRKTVTESSRAIAPHTEPQGGEKAAANTIRKRKHNGSEPSSSSHSGRWRTDKKEKKIFLRYKEIQNGSVAKSYMTNGLLL
jgi:hypothetical protein